MSASRAATAATISKLLVAGEDRELVRLALEAQRIEQGAARRGLALAPVGDARLVDEVDRLRGLAAVGAKEGGEVGHGAGEVTMNCSHRPAAPGSA